MESINQSWFLWLNAPAHANSHLLAFAAFLAESFIWIIPAFIGVGWLCGSEAVRKALLVATVSGIVALLFNQVIGLAWSHPRPFMIGLGRTYLPHVADSSFPSDHLSLWWAVAVSMILQKATRIVGTCFTVLGLSVAWARIYLGVHFPFDIIGSLAVAVMTAWTTLRFSGIYLGSAYRVTTYVHKVIFRRLIVRGWVRE